MGHPRHVDAVAVIGAGMAGAGVALELAVRGVPVVLIERDAQAFGRASLRNEGKIHLGLIYANDASLATARLQLRGALAFGGLLRRWLGAEAGRLQPSTPFHYVVAHDSLLSPEQLEAHYANVQRLYDEARRQQPDLDYLGGSPQRLYERVAAATVPVLAPSRFAAVFRTAEIAVDTAQLAARVRRAIDEQPLIELRCGHRVQSVSAGAHGFQIAGETAAGAWQIDAQQVVNCSWEDRLRIDRGAGREPLPGWVHRLKYRVIARLPPALRDGPSVTMVLGPYGDVVVRGDGSAYFSWYPVGLQGWTHALAPPPDWDGACRGELPADAAAAMAREVLSAIDTWYPGAADSEPLLVDAGVIVGYGSTDVHDPRSGLHDRTRIGVASHGGYHSLDPGKLTTAPLFACIAADRVVALR
jgi:glycine/D-amino acid oxidase-like deaminating enzyme